MKYFIQIDELYGEIYFSLWRDETDFSYQEYKTKSIIEIMNHIETRKLSIDDVLYSPANGYLKSSLSYEECYILPGKQKNHFILKYFNPDEEDMNIILQSDKSYIISESNDRHILMLGKRL